MLYTTRATKPTSRQDAVAFVREQQAGDNFFLAVTVPALDATVGTMGVVVDRQNMIAEQGIVIYPEFASRGFGLAAWSLCLNQMMELHGMRKVFAGTAASNIAMRRIMEKSSMRQEAVLPGHLLIAGEPTDAVFYSSFSEPRR